MPAVSEFKDHFSGHAADYAAHRPRYPAALFQWLSEQCAGHAVCWDCATGNGQAALSLARYFDQVIATDGSARQIENAIPHPKVDYRVASAEESGLDTGSVDLITVAQAAHWFDHQRFYDEVKRVANASAIIAIWGYGRHRVNEAVNGVMDHYYFDITGPYWPAERRYLDEELKTLPFPVEEISAPPFEMTTLWNLEALIRYLGTWSATQRYRKAHDGVDPIDQIRTPLRAAWGGSQSRKTVSWPLYLRAGRVM